MRGNQSRAKGMRSVFRQGCRDPVVQTALIGIALLALLYAHGCQPPSGGGDSDGDGVLDADDACPGTPSGTAVDSRGCPLDTDGDGVLDASDACPGTPLGTAVDSRGCPLIPGKLITEVQLSKTTLLRGEELEVTVRAEGPPGAKGTPIVVRIGGVTATKRYLHFYGSPGPRRINVTASTDGRIESETHVVHVVDPPATDALRVDVRQNPYRNYVLDFTVVDYQGLGLQGPYRWNWGDGKTTETKQPNASHDFRPSMDMRSEASTFQVVLTVGPLSHRETVTLISSYYLSRQRGVVQPQVVTTSSRSNRTYAMASYYLEHFEDEVVTIERRILEFLPCDPKQRSTYDVDDTPSPVIVREAGAVAPRPTLRARESINEGAQDPFVIPPKEKVEAHLIIEKASVPDDICIVACHLLGRTESGLKVVASVYVEVRRNPYSTVAVTDGATLAFLRELWSGAHAFVGDRTEITEEDLYEWERTGLIRRTAGGWEVLP